VRRRIDTETLKRLARAVSIAVGVAGAGLEFINKKDVLQIDANAALAGDTALADMPLSSFTLSVHPKRRRKEARSSAVYANGGAGGGWWRRVNARRSGALPQHYQQSITTAAKTTTAPTTSTAEQQQQQQHHQQQAQQQPLQQAQQQTNVQSDDDGSGGNNGASNNFNSNNVNEDEEDEDDRIDCICGRNDDRGFMLFCDRCRVWLHGKCVNITKKTVPEVFVCPRCIK
jgi:hypothetical protein